MPRRLLNQNLGKSTKRGRRTLLHNSKQSETMLKLRVKKIDPQHHFFQSLQKKPETFAWLNYKSGFKVPKSIQEDVTKLAQI